MICRHTTGDSSCSKHKNYVSPYSNSNLSSKNFDIEEVEETGNYLVATISLTSSYSRMTMVFADVTLKDAIHWKNVDQKFGNTKQSKQSKERAPCPIATFPANEQGWRDAMSFAFNRTREGK